MAPLKVSLPVPTLLQAVVLVPLLEITPLSVRSPVPPMVEEDRKLLILPLRLAAVPLLLSSAEVLLKVIVSAPMLCPLRSKVPPLRVVPPVVDPSALAFPSFSRPALILVVPV